GLSTEVRATTVNGDIQTDFPLMVTGRLGPRRLHGTIGSGGRRLALETVNGSIRLRKISSQHGMRDAGCEDDRTHPASRDNSTPSATARYLIQQRFVP